MATVATDRTSLVARAFVGSLLLAPAVLAFGLVSWYPAASLLVISVQHGVAGRPASLVGLANYAYLLRDATMGQAILHTFLVVLVRVVATTGLPALVAWLWARQWPPLRILSRLALSLGLAFSAPVALALLWRLAVLRVPALHGLSLGNLTTALPSYLLLESLTFLGFGGALAATALMLAWRRKQPGRTVPSLLALAALLAAASGLDTFALPFALTRGGPMDRTLTASLYAFFTAFQRNQLGRAAAQSIPLLLASVGLGLLFALISEALDLRLVEAESPERLHISWRHLLPGLLALGLLLLPPVLLYLHGAGAAFVSAGDPLRRVRSSLLVVAGLLDGSLAPLLTIVLIQLPIAYLAALSLALVRPFGRLGSRVAFALLVAGGFVPSVAVAMGLADAVRRLRIYDSPVALGVPLLAGAASLYILKLYFAGREAAIAQARRAGCSALGAFFRVAFLPSLPVAALAGAVSFLLSGQSLLWPLVALVRRDYYPLSLQLLAAGFPEPAQQAAGAWLVLTCWGVGLLLLWWPLQALVVERLELVAGKS